LTISTYKSYIKNYNLIGRFDFSHRQGLSMNVRSAKSPSVHPVVLTFCLSKNELAGLSRDFSILPLIEIGGAISIQNVDGSGKIDFPTQSAVAILADKSLLPPKNQRKLEIWAKDQGLSIPLVDFRQFDSGLILSLSLKTNVLARANADLLQKLATLREVHEELQNSYDELRTCVSDEGLLLPKCGFYNEPAPDVAVPDGTSTVQQPLPIEYRRISGISLYNVASVPSDAEGFVNLELYLPDDDSVEHVARAEFKELSPGWVTFAIEKRKGAFLRRNAALRVTYETEAGNAPRFAMGKAPVRPEKAAVIDGQTQSRALALKCWVSAAGAPLAITNEMWPTIHTGSERPRRLEISIDNNLEVIDVRRLGEQGEMKPVVRDANGRWILVHPFERTPTVAKLSNVCPEGTKVVAAEVETVNKLAGVVEYALAIGDHDENAPLDDLVETVQWTCLPAVTSSEIRLDLDEPLNACRDLILLTRLPENGSPDYCWARFKRIYLEGHF
jgi:hypothetical protein